MLLYLMDFIESNVIKHVHRYATYADYINIHQYFEWKTYGSGSLSLNSRSDIGTSSIASMWRYDAVVCCVTPCCYNSLQEGLDIVGNILVSADAFYGTLTPMTLERKQQIVLAVVAEIARNVRGEGSYEDVKRPVPIPFALTDSDVQSMREFSADLSCGDRLIAWINAENETYDICIRDVFGHFQVFRIIFDTIATNDTIAHNEIYLDDRVFRVRVLGDFGRVVEVRDVNIKNVKLSENMECDLLCDAERQREGIYAQVIVDQIKRVLSHEHVLRLFERAHNTVNMYMRDVLGYDIVKTNIPNKDF